MKRNATAGKEYRKIQNQTIKISKKKKKIKKMSIRKTDVVEYEKKELQTCPCLSMPINVWCV